MNPVLQRLRQFTESTLGVRVSRTRNVAPFHYLLTLRDWSPGDVILDVGANEGQTVGDLRTLVPAPRIFALEPVRSTFEVLRERTEGMSTVEPVRLALGAEPGTATMHLNEYSEWNSLSPDWTPHTGTETVPVSTIDLFLEEREVEFVHFLKVDTEGHDLEVLRGAVETLTASRVAIVQVEVRFDREGLDLEPFREYLGPLGYRLVGLYDQHRTGAELPASWGRRRVEGYRPEALAYCNAVFVCVGEARHRKQDIG